MCVSALADHPLQPEGESLNKDMMNGVREVDWVSIAPSVALLVGVLGTLLFPTWMVSAFGTAKVGPISATSYLWCCWLCGTALLEYLAESFTWWSFLVLWMNWETAEMLLELCLVSRLPTYSLPETIENTMVVWLEAHVLLLFTQWLSCFCIKWWFRAMSLLVMPLVHAAVNACTTAVSCRFVC